MKRKIFAFGILFIGLVFVGALSICIGSVNSSLSEIGRVLLGKTDGSLSRIIWEIRIPRVLAAFFLGGALSVSGYLMQTFFGNPIAGPFVLGISSGAKFTVALSMIFLLERGIHLNSLGMILSAAVGAMLTMVFVLLMSAKVRSMSILIVCGIMIGYITSAITDLLVTFANDANIVNLHNWSQGSFSGTNREQVKVLCFTVCVLVGCTLFLAKGMNAYRLGEEYAGSMGINTKRLRFFLILLSGLLAAVVTAFAGPISFVGIAVPHLIKKMMKSANALWMLPGCFLGGALVTAFCDLLARTIFAPTELNISTVTAILLVPVVLTMMLQKRKAVE